MALTEPNRSVVFRGLSNLLESEEAAVEMMSCLPSTAASEPATKADLDEQSVEVEKRFVEVDKRFVEVDKRFVELTAAMQVGFADQNLKLANMETRLMAHVHAEVQSSMHWTIGVVISFAVVLVGALALFV
ncbi:MAG: hypothetical protein WAX12_08160 [Candidatus Microthrix subdominans]|jgi:hypothetical protein|uniref:DUF1640 domain-containing protein n=1 Tax=Candidatus Neomicrothrix subdominans TaxID=2954438 RepID=A0A936NDA3_9ACTN|nr:hypothetical protein [Candidatus Microthrix sp.]MBK9296931.1 hypothetical protein [Candidatus Microthrix subdominans]MBK6311061.1 hypothetical protein [Candidatus Microthrix sp.]MBK6440438.1 hypothetical protein [Candidatus Microthrix sp.]MBK6971267.1 hypothetical protein [Candidatus Microthrix sp.]MBK7164098.1 hypothetical protein [Candidatus Microthrix sp.]